MAGSVAFSGSPACGRYAVKQLYGHAQPFVRHHFFATLADRKVPASLFRLVFAGTLVDGVGRGFVASGWILCAGGAACELARHVTTAACPCAGALGHAARTVVAMGAAGACTPHAAWHAASSAKCRIRFFHQLAGRQSVGRHHLARHAFFVARLVGQSYKSNLEARAQVVAGAAQLAEQRNFVALLSHEFRNPIAVLDGALSNLNRQSLDTLTSPRVGRMARAVERLKYVLSYCLADERLATLELSQPPRSRLAPSDIVEESLVQLDDESRRVQVLSNHHASTPLATGSVKVLGDLPMLGAALKNLLDNALKYGGTGPVQLSVHVEGQQVTFRVLDHGPGLDEESSRRLFEKFTRGQHHLSMPGAGLGLYLSQNIAKQHGGDISIRNPSGGGALAELTLPIIAI